ncbi:NAD(P)H-binding protein [Streptomyces sp. SBT349]|uniref:NAD(P)H-binding protein n=1 Tax=Streptomyces sp. SBT349 TaxID=1580539 RepID=UPI00066ED8DC|nr:NAD(P)H-binding protein [Streptomyces sp. SBT349]
MTQQPLLVIGGTGITGSRVVTRLRARGAEVRVGSRSGTPPFVWQDRATWDPVLGGARAVYVVPLDGALLTRPLVERAVELGVPRIVLLSGRGVDVPGYAPETSALGATHVDGEAAVRASGVAWTIVRPGWFAQNFSEGFLRDDVLAGELRLPGGDGAASFVDAEDIADVAVAALTEEGHAGRIYELSGPRALTLEEAAGEIAEATGRPVRYVPLTVEEYTSHLTAQGWSPGDARDAADAVAPLRRDLDSHLSHGVREALGREPGDFSAFVKEAVRQGAWGG